MLRLTKFYCRSFDLDSLTVWWEIDDIINLTDDIYAYEFTLSKSESPAGPYDVVFGPFMNIFSFRDSIHPENHKNRTIYYKLLVKDKRNQESREYGPTAQIPEPNLEALEMIRLEDVLFRGFIGRKWYVFPRKTFGVRCHCFNKIMQRIEIGNCKDCYRTGYEAGFSSPIAFFAQCDPNPKNIQKNPDINHNVNITQLRTISYPPISNGDILVSPENHRWVCIQSTPTQRLGYDIHQEVTIKELLKGSIEYLLPINDDIKNIAGISERRNFTNPTSLNNEPKPNYLGDVPDGILY